MASRFHPDRPARRDLFEIWETHPVVMIDFIRDFYFGLPVDR